jgi:glutamate synthase (ferredoxin)
MIEMITSVLLSVLVLGIFLLILVGVIVVLAIIYKDKHQDQHSILRTHPFLARVRYFAEKVSPEFKDYFGNVQQPFSKDDLVTVAKRAKYLSNMSAFGSERDYDAGGFFLNNSMFPVPDEDMKLDTEVDKSSTKKYLIDKEGLFSRDEHMVEHKQDRYLLKDEDAIILGKDSCEYPFKVKGQIGMSAMSYGSIGSHGIRALSHGLSIAGGTWMNTGEGGLSNYHLEGGVDLIMQIGPGKFGVRHPDGSFNWEELKNKSEIPQVKAFEIKLAQGAKIMGGRLPGAKVTPEIALIRGVEPWQDVDSPKRFDEFSNEKELLEFVTKIREVTGKPVGIKIVVGSEASVDSLMWQMKATGLNPDFITVDSGDGGSGKAPKSHMNSLGIGIKTSLPIVDRKLKDIGLRDKVKIIASGKLIHSERVAVALALGADLVNTSRGMMMASGCIFAGVCDKNTCPVGLATTDPKLMQGLVVDEKKYRVANYVLSLREELFSLASACGIDTPAHFDKEHIVYVNQEGKIVDLFHVEKGYTDFDKDLVIVADDNITNLINEENELVG